MSWHVTATLDGGRSQEQLAALRADVESQNSGAGDQFEAAVRAAYAILSSGAIGGLENKFNVTMSGHANPDRAPREGWANDYIVVNVSQG